MNPFDETGSRVLHEATDAIAGHPGWQLVLPPASWVTRRATLRASPPLPEGDYDCDVVYHYPNGPWYWSVYYAAWRYHVAGGACNSCLAGVQACESLIARPILVEDDG
jgi:hypothetical protein